MANKIEIPFAAANGGQDCALLASKNPMFPYENGKKASDKPTGFKFSAVLHGNRMASLNVKIEGGDPLPNITDEQIGSACASGKYLYARFLDCIVTMYTINGQMQMSAAAKGVELLSNSKQ